jgi:sigma-E factor negative regulatory protein RseB
VRRLRLAAVLAGVGAFVTCLPSRAVMPPEPVHEEAVADERSAAALAVLSAAAAAARAQVWTGTEEVVSLVSGSAVRSVVTVEHGPGRHSASDAMDSRLFSLLASHYDLQLGAVGLCAGRKARLIEARRTTDGSVAGRFWVDTRSGLLLRREVLDARGDLLRRSSLVAVQPGTSSSPAALATAALTSTSPSSERLDEAALQRFERDGWPVLRALPGNLDLYEARWLTDGVLQLAYSDGLSTLSLFVQRGGMPPIQAGVVRRVGGGTVWQSPGEPERVVWAANGLTWTLVSDVDPELVDRVLVALPHTQGHVAQDGMAPRVWRGMSRVGAWLNPF